MRRRIARYRRDVAGRLGDFVIGCRILTNLSLAGGALVPASSFLLQNIVSFKTYGTEEREGRWLWDVIPERLAALPLDVSNHALARQGSSRRGSVRERSACWSPTVTDGAAR